MMVMYNHVKRKEINVERDNNDGYDILDFDDGNEVIQR